MPSLDTYALLEFKKKEKKRKKENVSLKSPQSIDLSEATVGLWRLKKKKGLGKYSQEKRIDLTREKRLGSRLLCGC